MLRALCEYYDCLRARNDENLVPAGYSRVNVSWNLVLRPDGGIKDILPYVEEKVIGKKIGTVGREEIFPFRNSIPGIAAETVDHREKYLFGLVWDKESQSLRAEPKALEAFEAAANGQATKLIIPSEIQGLAGLCASAKAAFESAGEGKK